MKEEGVENCCIFCCKSLATVMKTLSAHLLTPFCDQMQLDQTLDQNASMTNEVSFEYQFKLHLEKAHAVS